MGQLFSSSNNEQDQDLASSFTRYFKKFKVENSIIPQETIASVELSLTKGNIQGANSAISDALREIDGAPLNVAVTGESGAGKSTFINALRGIGHEEKDAAQIGVVETTMERHPYEHPSIPNVVIWDLPGIGTTNFPPKDYLEKMKFNEYDFFIIVSATRFKKNDIDLAKAVSMMKKDFYFVRTKVDSDLKNEEELKPRSFDREKVLQQIRSSCVKNFQDSNIDEPPIFLISNVNLCDYDFPILMDKLVNGLPVHKRHKFMLSLPNISDAAIERKRQFLKQRIWLEAFASDLLSIIPSLVFLLDSDMENLKKSMKLYRTVFGVDDASLQSLARDWQMPVDQLEAMMKSPNVFKTAEKETIQEKLSRYCNEYCVANGYLVTKNVYLRELFYLKFYFLDLVTEDANVLLREICSRNNLITN
ncbi:interferon-inducible GTPase 1-like [Acomys russatus]|uniref:interferon-inducible GTPase 1-like n=1 Tax=Acomys russatus TaxID=60746 RepID=UPI0021E30B6D|nr:interferon-inducible GTPase 1-like [Acomys russatus]